jgi:hypothetical protein
MSALMLVIGQFRIKDLELTQTMMVLAMESSTVIVMEVSQLVVMRAVVSVPVYLLVAMTSYHLQSVMVTVSHYCCCQYYQRLVRMLVITMSEALVIVKEVSLVILMAVATEGSPVMVM